MKTSIYPAFIAALLLSTVGLARAEIAVVVNPKAPVTALSVNQAAQVFSGRAGSYRLLDLPESSALRSEFYRKTTEKDPAQMKALWAKLIFTGRAAPPKEVNSAAEIKKAVAADEKAMGYIDAKEVDGSVKVVLLLN